MFVVFYFCILKGVKGVFLPFLAIHQSCAKIINLTSGKSLTKLFFAKPAIIFAKLSLSISIVMVYKFARAHILNEAAQYGFGNVEADVITVVVGQI